MRLPRINIEDGLYLDGRFMRLTVRCGNLDTAIGSVVRAFTVAQRYWVPDRKLIPKIVFDREELNPLLIELELARIVGDGVYICGSEEQFAWLIQKHAAGKRGGDERALRYSKSQANFSSVAIAAVKRRSSGVNPPALPLSLNTNTIAQFEIAQVYQSYPRKRGKTPGLKKLAKEIRSQEDFDACLIAVANFKKAMTHEERKPEHIPYFSSWVTEWRDWIDPEPGHLAKQSVLIGDLT